MKRTLQLFAFSFLLAGCMTASATAQTTAWRRVIGIALPGNVVGVGTGAIAGGGLPWTSEGFVRVNLQNGEIHFSVRGLVFAAGSATITIGTPGPITAVKGVLVCDTNGSAGGGNSVLVETASVPLSSSGDAEFTGNLGPLPSVCSSEPDLAFVVRASAIGGQPVEGPWIAAGVSRLSQ